MLHKFSVRIFHGFRLGGKHSSQTVSSVSSISDGKTFKTLNSKMQKTQVKYCKGFAFHSLQVMRLYFSLLFLLHQFIAHLSIIHPLQKQ